jgi:hypothetical protein
MLLNGSDVVVEILVLRLFFLPEKPEMSPAGEWWGLNSLPAIDAHERQLFDKLLWGLVTLLIFVRC